MTSNKFNPFHEERKKSKGEEEVEQGLLLLMIMRWLRVPITKTADERAIRRVGELLVRKYPFLVKWERLVLKHYGVIK